MPYKGHKTVTLTEEQVTKLEDQYYTNIKKYREMNLKSFSRFVQYRVDLSMDIDPIIQKDTDQE